MASTSGSTPHDFNQAAQVNQAAQTTPITEQTEVNVQPKIEQTTHPSHDNYQASTFVPKGRVAGLINQLQGAFKNESVPIRARPISVSARPPKASVAQKADTLQANIPTRIGTPTGVPTPQPRPLPKSPESMPKYAPPEPPKSPESMSERAPPEPPTKEGRHSIAEQMIKSGEAPLPEAPKTETQSTPKTQTAEKTHTAEKTDTTTQDAKSKDKISEAKTQFNYQKKETIETEKGLRDDMMKLRSKANQMIQLGKDRGKPSIVEYGQRLKSEVDDVLKSSQKFRQALLKAAYENDHAKSANIIAGAYEKHGKEYFAGLESFTLKYENLQEEFTNLENAHPKSMSMLKNITNPSGGLSMKDYIIKPFQRLTKHPMLLKNLSGSLKDFDTNAKANIDTQSAVVNKTLDNINSNKRERDIAHVKAEILATLAKGKASESLGKGIQKYISNQIVNNYEKNTTPDKPMDINNANIEDVVALNKSNINAYEKVESMIAEQIDAGSTPQEKANIREGLFKTALELFNNGDIASANHVLSGAQKFSFNEKGEKTTSDKEKKIIDKYQELSRAITRTDVLKYNEHIQKNKLTLDGKYKERKSTEKILTSRHPGDIVPKTEKAIDNQVVIRQFVLNNVKYHQESAAAHNNANDIM